jgi:biopolymer transport protein ExbB/TolQ
VSEAAILFSVLNRLPRALQNTYLANRVAAVLDFLMRRGSAAELDDQLRDLADADNVALENSFALVRFITWAIPILGFLGTVLGITGAISGVTPERLENDLNSVTDGLALAFDATALALGLTMLTMFFTYLVDRLEQNVLENVDRYVARHLAHRFERPGTENNQFRDMVEQTAQAMLKTSEELVQRQAQVWAQTLVEVDRGRSQVEERLQNKLTTALETALEGALQAHGQRLALLEKQTLEQGKDLFGQVAVLAAAVGRQQEALGQTAQGLASLATAVAQIQDGEQQLIRLQETLARNLEVLTGAGSFEQAVHALTAAIHLLTARATTPPIAGTVGSAGKRPGVAA